MDAPGSSNKKGTTKEVAGTSTSFAPWTGSIISMLNGADGMGFPAGGVTAVTSGNRPDQIQFSREALGKLREYMLSWRHWKDGILTKKQYKDKVLP